MNIVNMHRTIRYETFTNKFALRKLTNRLTLRVPSPHHEMIYEITVSKIVDGNFLIILSVAFYQWFYREKKFLEPQSHLKLKYLKIDLSQKFPNTVLKTLSKQLSWKGFFSKETFLQGLGTFYTNTKPLIWASCFAQKIDFILFLSSEIL